MGTHEFTVSPAFILSIKLREGETVIGPDGVLTQLRTLFSPEGGGWIFDRFYDVRDNVITFVFEGSQRAEVMARVQRWSEGQ